MTATIIPFKRPQREEELQPYSKDEMFKLLRDEGRLVYNDQPKLTWHGSKEYFLDDEELDREFVSVKLRPKNKKMDEVEKMLDSFLLHYYDGEYEEAQDVLGAIYALMGNK
jgi:hypothetical protein